MYKYLKKAISIACVLPMIGSSLGGYQTAFCQNLGISENQNGVGNSGNSTIQTRLFGFNLVQNLTHNNNPILVYEHEKTGAQVCIEKNNNPDKQFNICFRTPAEDDKGTNHVIEHCIMNGSEKYPLKNMIFELKQLAYHTDMNASTEQDYTYFSVSSLDEDELNSLAHIYVDSVFNPKFLKDEKIFKKEGIRYGIDDSQQLIANGTVFNEMIGQYSNIEYILLNNSKKDLSPDTQERFNAGGYPTDIMDLTYEDVCKTYGKYYHPSNCMFHMAGNINYARFLEWIDGEYLSKYDKRDMSSVKYEVHNTSGKDSFVTHNYYANAKDDALRYASISYILEDKEYKNSDKWEKLCDLLNDPDSSRVRKIKKMGYTDINASFSYNTFCQPVFTVSFSAQKNQFNLFNLITQKNLMMKKNLQKTMDEFLLKNPITQDEVNIYMKGQGFSKKFNKNNKIYDYSLNTDCLMTSFAKYGTPCSDKYFNFDAIRDDSINRDINASEFNDLIKSSLNNKRQCITVHNPSNNKSLQIQEQISKKLKSKAADKDRLTQGYIEQNTWSDTPNSQKDIQKLRKMFKPFADINIPKLQLTVGNSPITIGSSADKVNSDKIIEKPCYMAEIDTGEFNMYKIIFNTNHIPKDKINYLCLFLDFSNELGTEQYSKEDLINESVGKADFNNMNNHYLTKNLKLNNIFQITALTTKDNINKSFELLKERLFHTNYSDKTEIIIFIDDCINDLKINNQTQYDEYVFCSSHQNLLSLHNNENFSNVEYVKFLKNIKENIDNKEFMNNLKTELEDIRDSVINQNSYEASGICGSSESIELIRNEIDDLINEIPIGNVGIIKDLDIDPLPSAKKVFIDPSQGNNTITQIINMGASNQDASWNVLSRIVNISYLNPKIREQGGAYSSGMYINKEEGIVILCSSKDPNLLSTLDAFSGLPNFIDNLELTQQELDIYAKSVVNNLLPSEKIFFAMDQISSIICGTENFCESTNSRIDQLKSTTPEKLRECAKVLRNAIDNNQSTISILAGKITPKERQLLQDQGFEIVESSSK